MKIVINALSARRGGGQTYLLNLLQNLDHCKATEIMILAPESLNIPTNPKIKRIEVNWPIDNPLLRTLWERYLLSGLLKKLNADVLFCPGGLVTSAVPNKCKTVTMFRNMIPFDPAQRAKYPFGLMKMRNWLLERALLKSMIKADICIFISDFARQVIEERAKGCLNNTIIIPHGLSEHFKIPVNSSLSRPKWLPKDEYLLYVSIFDVYKNQLEVVRGFHLLKSRRKTQEKLVLAGFNSSKYGQKVRSEIFRLGLQNDVILTGNITYIELPNIYYHAKINIFASECENCPNILLEALGAGRPLIVSNRQPMPEFGGDAVTYFNPSSPEDLALKLVSIIDDSVLMQNLSARARERSRQFCWKQTARMTWEAINQR